MLLWLLPRCVWWADGQASLLCQLCATPESMLGHGIVTVCAGQQQDRQCVYVWV